MPEAAGTKNGKFYIVEWKAMLMLSAHFGVEISSLPY